MTDESADEIVRMFAANWDRHPWDEHKIELWHGMLREVKADGTALYGQTESICAARHLIRVHKYPSIQFSDFDGAVRAYRIFVREKAEKLMERRLLELAGDLETRRARVRSLAPLLRLAAPRKV